LDRFLERHRQCEAVPVTEKPLKEADGLRFRNHVRPRFHSHHPPRPSLCHIYVLRAQMSRCSPRLDRAQTPDYAGAIAKPNALIALIEQPTQVELLVGEYRVMAWAKGYRTVTVPVVILRDQLAPAGVVNPPAVVSPPVFANPPSVVNPVATARFDCLGA